MSISSISSSPPNNLSRYVVTIGCRESGNHVGTSSINGFFTICSDNYHPLVREAKEEHRGIIDRFINGKSSLETVEESVRNVFQTVINANLANGLISGDDPEEYLKLIQHTYHHLRLILTPRIDQAHALEGREIAKKHGLVKDGAAISDWVYYNSNYFFIEKDIVDIMNSVGREFMKEHGVGDRELV